MAKGVEDTDVLPLHRLVAAQRGRRRPGRARAAGPSRLHAWATPAAAASPARDDDAVDARHQAQRGRPGPAARARRRSRRLGRRRGREVSAARPRQHVVDGPTALPAVPDPRRGVADRRRTGSTAYLVRRRPRGQAAHVLDRPGRRLRRRACSTFAAALPRRRRRRRGDRGGSSPSAGWSIAAASTRWPRRSLQLTLPGVPDIYQGSEPWASASSTPTTAGRSTTSALRRGCARRRRPRRARTPGRRRRDRSCWLVHQAARLRRDRPELFGADATYTAARVVDGHAAGRSSASGRRGRRDRRRLVGPLGDGWGEHRDRAARRRVDRRAQRRRVRRRRGPAGATLLRRFPVAVLVEEADA